MATETASVSGMLMVSRRSTVIRERNKVKKGDKVKAGQVIGLTGRTGRATTEHLHFEVSFGGRRLDPAIIYDHGKHQLKPVTLHLTKGRGVKSVKNQ